MIHDAVFTVEYEDDQQARLVERSVRQELDQIAGDRTETAITRDGETLELTVRATDLVALRAGLNTWLTLVSVAERVVGGEET